MGGCLGCFVFCVLFFCSFVLFFFSQPLLPHRGWPPLATHPFHVVVVVAMIGPGFGRCFPFSAYYQFRCYAISSHTVFRGCGKQLSLFFLSSFLQTPSYRSSKATCATLKSIDHQTVNQLYVSDVRKGGGGRSDHARQERKGEEWQGT